MTKPCLGAGVQHFKTTMKQDTVKCSGSMNSKFPTNEGFVCGEIKHLGLETYF
jgi:hypothetical protein